MITVEVHMMRHDHQPLPAGFRDIDDLIAEFEAQPDGAERMQRARLVQRLAPASIRTFVRIAAAWKVGVDQQMCLLGGLPRPTFLEWCEDPEHSELTLEMLQRISYVFGIYKALHILFFPRTERADEWITKPNSGPGFDGQSALERMLCGRVEDLAFVRRYLDAQIDGVWMESIE